MDWMKYGELTDELQKIIVMEIVKEFGFDQIDSFKLQDIILQARLKVIHNSK